MSSCKFCEVLGLGKSLIKIQHSGIVAIHHLLSNDCGQSSIDITILTVSSFREWQGFNEGWWLSAKLSTPPAKDFFLPQQVTKDQQFCSTCY